ncbi:MAG: dihydroorotase [Rhodospirillales bacterium]|nr:dihydroorotase [Rhodospirillales bacterium]MBO6785975.1 dihydroorotase [Rhodospirillales bacterium]
MALKADRTPGRVAYVGARLLDPATGMDEVGGVLTEGELIKQIGPKVNADLALEGVTVIDCEGLCLAPGLIDMRVHLGEPGEDYKETLASAGRAATKGGITSMVCLPNTDPVIDDMSVVEFVARRARLQGLSKVYPYGAVTKGLGGKEIAELGLLAESGAVAFTDGFSAVANAQVMRRAMMYARTFDLLICQHPEEPSLATGGAMNAGETATRLGLVGIPREAEIMMIERDIRLVELTGGKLHIAHVSTADSVDVIRKAKARGLTVTCDTSPPYFALNEVAIGDYRTFAKLSPPLRSEADRQAVVDGIKDGTIDCIASDHTPQDEESKRLPFGAAASGGVGLETLLSVTLELYHNGHVPLLDALKFVTSAPADLLKLRAGKLVQGRPADLILFDPDKGWKIEADKLLSKSKNTPFDGRLVQGTVTRTVIDGRTVFVAD